MAELTAIQRRLDDVQLAEFYIDEFVATQVAHFLACFRHRADDAKTVVDIGGGCGYFAHAVRTATGLTTRVIDLDARAIQQCRNLHASSVEAIYGDAISPPHRGDEGVVCFNLVLHHLVGDCADATRQLQKQALITWRNKADFLFVNEYIYESPLNISGHLIYNITRSRVLSLLGRLISRAVPSLRANTFGVGVRFRSSKEWIALFNECGYDVIEQIAGESEKIALPRRLLLIQSISRNSYLLKAR